MILSFIVNGLLTKDVASGVYNINDDEAVSTNELIEIICGVTGHRTYIWRIPQSLMKCVARIGGMKGKAKCFAGDVGSLSIGFILLFAIGRLIVKTGDVTWFLLLAIYGVDGYLTIVHRVMLHDNIGKAHRKHAYQLMANELKMSHIWVSLIYMTMQLAVSLVAIYVIPDTIVAHWIYLVAVGLVLALAYVLFMMKYYHLHEEYLSSLRSSEM